MKIGDYVTRFKYKNDILFRIKKFVNEIAILEGVYIRLVATAPLIDLRQEMDIACFKLVKDLNPQTLTDLFYKNHKAGKILHIDSDINYLIECESLYSKLGLNSICIYLKEVEIKTVILKLCRAFRPDILILTGHDAYNQKGLYDLANYTNTKHFMDAICIIRKYYSIEDLFIYAGACGSNFEALIAAGANFASSPKRVNIDLYDPAICAIKVATTPFNQIVSINEIWAHSLTKEAGIKGLEAYGKLRILN